MCLIRRSRCSAIVLALSVAMPFAFAQSTATPGAAAQPEFEAVSIHLVDAHSNEESSVSSFPANLLRMRNVPLSFLIQFVYNVDSQDHVSATPSWMDAQVYDVEAKVEGDQQLTFLQMRPLLQRMLEQRFHFAGHHEMKMVSGFVLTVAKGGPRLQASKDDERVFAQLLPNRMDVRHLDMEHIAGVLAHRAGQPVIDKTGLTGSYDFRLSYASANDSNSSLPDFFTALQEQLGLKLEPQKVPVDFLVIDHVDRVPTEN